MAFVERGRSTEHLMGIGDRHEGSGWMAVCALDDIAPGRGVVRVVNGLDLAVMRDGDGSPDDAVHALGNLCPHRGGQLGDGKVVDGKAIDPFFNINTPDDLAFAAEMIGSVRPWSSRRAESGSAQ